MIIEKVFHFSTFSKENTVYPDFGDETDEASDRTALAVGFCVCCA